MAAGVAGQAGRRVLLIDHADEPGKRPHFGGGRCNFTNLRAAPDRFISQSPFQKSAMARYNAARFHRPGRAARNRPAEKTLGQLFCDGSSRRSST